MSLLLDALKKAAQKKAKKSAESDDNAESTEIAGSENTAINDTIAPDHESTQHSQFAATTEMDATSIEETEINESSPESAFAETVEQDSTELDNTSITDSVTFDADSTLPVEDTRTTAATEIGSTQLDNTSITDGIMYDPDTTLVDKDAQFATTTEMDATSIEETEINATVSGAAFSDTADQDSTQLDNTSFTDNVTFDADSIVPDEDSRTTSVTTEKDSTQLDNTSITDGITYGPDSTQLDADTQFAATTEMDATSAQQADEADGVFDTALYDTIASDEEPTELGQNVPFDDTTEMDVTSLDRTEIKDDTELEYQSQLAEEDRTLFIYDGADQSSDVADERTQAGARSDTDDLYNAYSKNEEDSLTDDDVTQFMGDGVSDLNSSSTGGIKSDDTTLTNPESLTLTNFSFGDEKAEETAGGEAELIHDKTESDTFSLREHDGQFVADRTTTEGLNLEAIADDEKSTRINTDLTSTVSSIDIEQLTSDEIVSLDSATAAKSFAPDNYDRTLLNLSEKDVSKIFPGLRPESDTVMTPDYAKRIFQSKSGQLKTRYYKVYAGLGLFLLLSVVVVGLFQLQNESDLIDQRLMNLKRDPMPGLIKPRTDTVSAGLFVSSPRQSKLKTIDIISSAGEQDMMSSSSLTDKVDEIQESTSTKQSVDQQEFAVNRSVEKNDGAAETPSVKQDNVVEQKPQNKITPVIAKKTARPKSSSNLSITSSSQVSQKNQMLTEAYNAYEQGNMTTAKSLYNKVLALDELNRDGILGRAAIHIQQNEYQQAIDKYQQLLVENPKDSMAMASLISVANIDPQSGETQLKTLLREQPESAYLHFALGNMYGSQNRWREAQGAYFAALQNKPHDPNYAYNLAVSLEHIGKTVAATIFYKKALDNSSRGLVTFDDQLVMQRLEVLAQ